MKRIRKTPKRTASEAIARLADQGKDVSLFFTNSGRMMEPIQRVNVPRATALRGSAGHDRIPANALSGFRLFSAPGVYPDPSGWSAAPVSSTPLFSFP